LSSGFDKNRGELLRELSGYQATLRWKPDVVQKSPLPGCTNLR
jgi:hypothetical protein